MKKIIPFLFGVIVLVTLVLMRMHAIQASQTKDGAVVGVDEAEDASLVENAAYASSTTIADVELFEPPHVVVSLATTVGTTTMSAQNGAVQVAGARTVPQLIQVQPGFGGGGGGQQLQNLPEYKEEPDKVEPVVEFEYCN